MLPIFMRNKIKAKKQILKLLALKEVKFRLLLGISNSLKNKFKDR